MTDLNDWSIKAGLLVYKKIKLSTNNNIIISKYKRLNSGVTEKKSLLLFETCQVISNDKKQYSIGARSITQSQKELLEYPQHCNRQQTKAKTNRINDTYQQQKLGDAQLCHLLIGDLLTDSCEHIFAHFWNTSPHRFHLRLNVLK